MFIIVDSTWMRRQHFPGWPSPVISATMSRKSKCLSVLLNSGKADVNFVDKFGENAILEASHRGMESHTELLLQHGADVNSRSEGVYNRKRTPLMNAACNGYHGMIKMLIFHKADVDLTDSLGRTAFPLQQKADIFTVYWNCIKLVAL